MLSHNLLRLSEILASENVSTATDSLSNLAKIEDFMLEVGLKHSLFSRFALVLFDAVLIMGIPIGCLDRLFSEKRGPIVSFLAVGVCNLWLRIFTTAMGLS